MNRREFAKTAAGAAFSMALPANSVLDAAADVKPTVPFKLSVMLWTVNKQLPFEQRLEKVAEAGYGAVELVNEFLKWSDEDFRRMNNKKRSLGITFDATAGVWKGVADPGGRDAFLTDLQNFFPVAHKLGGLKYDRYAAMVFEPTGDVVTSLRGARELALRAVSASQ